VKLSTNFTWNSPTNYNEILPKELKASHWFMDRGIPPEYNENAS